jgi:TolA-binding protein
MRRRQEEDSSLELLLDTMCNTFGGVMFIAISLAVMLSMRSAVNAVPADTSAEIRAVQQRIAELQLELEQQKNQVLKQHIQNLLVLEL